jgi:hypothetical protein
VDQEHLAGVRKRFGVGGQGSLQARIEHQGRDVATRPSARPDAAAVARAAWAGPASLGTVVSVVTVGLLRLDPVQFTVHVPSPFMLGSLVVLSMLRGPLIVLRLAALPCS